MEWSREDLESKSKEELIQIIINFQEDFEEEFFSGIDDGLDTDEHIKLK